jgi:hypothetical protein
MTNIFAKLQANKIQNINTSSLASSILEALTALVPQRQL